MHHITLINDQYFNTRYYYRKRFTKISLKIAKNCVFTPKWLSQQPDSLPKVSYLDSAYVKTYKTMFHLYICIDYTVRYYRLYIGKFIPKNQCYHGNHGFTGLSHHGKEARCQNSESTQNLGLESVVSLFARSNMKNSVRPD